MVRSHQFALRHKGNLERSRPSSQARATSSPTSVPSSARSARYSLFTIHYPLCFDILPGQSAAKGALSVHVLRPANIYLFCFQANPHSFRPTPGQDPLVPYPPPPRLFRKNMQTKDLRKGGLQRICKQRTYGDLWGLMAQKPRSARSFGQRSDSPERPFGSSKFNQLVAPWKFPLPRYISPRPTPPIHRTTLFSFPSLPVSPSTHAGYPLACPKIHPSPFLCIF